MHRRMWLLEARLEFALFSYKDAENNKKLGGEGENVYIKMDWLTSLPPSLISRKALSAAPELPRSLSLFSIHYRHYMSVYMSKMGKIMSIIEGSIFFGDSRPVYIENGRHDFPMNQRKEI